MKERTLSSEHLRKPLCLTFICFRDHSNNRELFDVTLRLLVNLTNPELLLFKVGCSYF